jgi:hypothetical protein
LSGIPTGTTWSGTPPPAGEAYNTFFDGTSDGTRNYTVEYRNSNQVSGIDLEANVIATDLNWQNPVVLFSIPGVLFPQRAFAGVTYDPTNNSLWFSGSGSLDVVDYSLTGELLSSFTAGVVSPTRIALAFDPADATLWLTNCCNQLYQYSRVGILLQSGTPSGLPDQGEFTAGEFAEPVPSGVPEPSTLPLFATGLGILGLLASRRRRLRSAPFLLIGRGAGRRVLDFLENPRGRYARGRYAYALPSMGPKAIPPTS